MLNVQFTFQQIRVRILNQLRATVIFQDSLDFLVKVRAIHRLVFVPQVLFYELLKELRLLHFEEFISKSKSNEEFKHFLMQLLDLLQRDQMQYILLYLLQGIQIEVLQLGPQEVDGLKLTLQFLRLGRFSRWLLLLLIL